MYNECLFNPKKGCKIMKGIKKIQDIEYERTVVHENSGMEEHEYILLIVVIVSVNCTYTWIKIIKIFVKRLLWSTL